MTIPYQQETRDQLEDKEENTSTNNMDHRPPNGTEPVKDNSKPEKIELEPEAKDHIDTESDEDQENEDSDNKQPTGNLRNRDKRQKDYAALHQGGPLQTKRKNSTSIAMKKQRNTPDWHCPTKTLTTSKRNYGNSAKQMRNNRKN